MYSLRNFFYILLGSLSLGLGLTGVILPVIPTTPFIVASCYFYSKGSKTFHNWLIHSFVYQKYAKDFIEHKQLSLKRKIGLLTFASIMLLFPLFILDGILKLVIIIIYLYLYYYFIFKIKTITYHTEEPLC